MEVSVTPHHDEVVFNSLGDLQSRLDAARHFLGDVLYVRCYAKLWWSDLTDEEQDAVMSAEQMADPDTRLRRLLDEIAAVNDLTRYTGREPDDDGLVYCCVTLGRVTPAEAADHLWDYPGGG
jgi:hypothetical protein